MRPPRLPLFCSRCNEETPFLCRERFRINAQKGLLDVWLLYRCPHCGLAGRWRVHRRIPARELGTRGLEDYQRDAASLVWQHAFGAPTKEAVPYAVMRPTLCASRGSARSSPLEVEIVQPHLCRVRWDRMIARELGFSRSEVTRRLSEILAEGAPIKRGRIVQHGDRVTLGAAVIAASPSAQAEALAGEVGEIVPERRRFPRPMRSSRIK